MADDLGEKTEDPTAKRLTDARNEGNVPRSTDLSGACVLLGGTLAIWVAVEHLFGAWKMQLANVLDGDTISDPLDPSQVMSVFTYIGANMIRVLVPVLLAAFVVSFAANFFQIGWLFSMKALQPSLNRLNPATGFKRIFGVKGLAKVGFDILKLIAVLILAIILMQRHFSTIVGLSYLSPLMSFIKIGHMMLELALVLLAVLFLLALIDLIFQRWKYKQDLKMTKQQVKDEMRSAEGDPQVKKRRLRMAQQVAMQRISAAVPRADVIVTNPEHIAVAISYDSATMRAPKVIAKGADFLAMRIRQIGMRHGIPIVERKPLARALYAQVEVNQEVPPDFYQAVAEILAYVYRLNGSMAG